MIKEYASNLSQSERLALCSGRFSPAILGAESPVTTLSRPPFPISAGHAARVRLNDARLMRDGFSYSADTEDGEECEELEGEETSHASERAWHLPSTRSRSYVSRELRAMGVEGW